MLSTNCILWTRQTPSAKRSFGIEAGAYLLAPAGPERKTLKRSMRISSLHQRTKSSTLSVMRAFSRMDLTQSPSADDRWLRIVNELEISIELTIGSLGGWSAVRRLTISGGGSVGLRAAHGGQKGVIKIGGPAGTAELVKRIVRTWPQGTRPA